MGERGGLLLEDNWRQSFPLDKPVTPVRRTSPKAKAVIYNDAGQLSSFVSSDKLDSLSAA